MSHHYEFADIRIQVEGREGELYADHGILAPFCSAETDEAEHHLSICLVDGLSQPVGSCIYQDPSKQIYKIDDEVIRYAGNEGCFHMRIRRQGCRSDVQCRRSAYPAGITPKTVLNAMEAEHLIVQSGGVLLHASFIRVGDRAILFTAPSGTGKSTQAELWCRYMGAELINGDRVAVMCRSDGIFACGIPFAGSSGVSQYAKLPLAAIVYLSQAEENTVESLAGLIAFRKIWEGCSVHTWDREDLSMASKTVLEVLEQVPVFYLRCRPDEKAVNVLHSFLMARNCL